MDFRQRGTRVLAGVAVALVTLAGTGCSAISSVFGGDQGSQGQAGGPGRRGGFDTDALATALADGLGVDKAKVTAALQEVTGSMPGRGSGETPPADGNGGTPPSDRPSFDGTPPADGSGRSGMAERIASALATSLGVDEAKVLEIVQQYLPGAGSGVPTPAPTSS